MANKLPGMLCFEQHSRIQDLEALWHQLDQTAQQQQQGYIHYTYYQTYTWNAFIYHQVMSGLSGCTSTMRFHLALLDGQPFAIIGLVITRSSHKARIPSCRVGGVLNMACPYPYEGHEEIMDAIADHLLSTSQGMTLSLADVPCVTAFAHIMQRICPDTIERTSFHVPLSQFATHEEYVSSLPKNIYKNIRKAYNHLKSDHKELTLRRFTHDHQAPDSYLRHLWRFYFRRKMMWRDQKPGPFTRLTVALKALYEVHCGCATASLKRLTEAELYVLEIDHQPAAFMIVYRHQGHLLMPRLAIDTRYGRYSPGILLILEASKQWIDEGIVDFDMCRGDERYKKEMGGINQPLCRIEKHIA